jgi:hypothetical protein
MKGVSIARPLETETCKTAMHRTQYCIQLLRKERAYRVAFEHAWHLQDLSVLTHSTMSNNSFARTYRGVIQHTYINLIRFEMVSKQFSFLL